MVRPHIVLDLEFVRRNTKMVMLDSVYTQNYCATLKSRWNTAASFSSKSHPAHGFHGFYVTSLECVLA